MSNSLCFTPLTSFKAPRKPGLIGGISTAPKIIRINDVTQNSKMGRFKALEVKATEGKQGNKPNSLLCADCDGNGVVSCSQCKGRGVNSVDHFNGQFKAGGLCWLCRGKKEILCGGCNGAGFRGGFMSSAED